MGRNGPRYLYALVVLLALSTSSIVPSFHLADPTRDSGLKDIVVGTLPAKENLKVFTPTLLKPAWVDQDNNQISDVLDTEIANKIIEGTAGNYVNVTVALRTQPTADDANAFTFSGGYLTTYPWTHAIYGFGGEIPYNRISDFAKSDANVVLIEKEQIGHTQIAYASSQIGARPYVWNTLGLQGDPQSSVAVVDTGIDDSHPDFSPGFGDKDFTRKIVGWNDQITLGTTSPYDDEGHGSHVSGLAAGNGFFSTDPSGNATATWGANLGRVTSTGTYFISGMMVNRTGPITIQAKWTNTGTGKLSAVQLYYGDKTLSSGSWTQLASVSTTSKDTWYSLTHQVPSTPTGGYDMYHVTMSLKAGTGNLYVVFTMSWPYTPPTDGFPAWNGIAPEAKLVGVKVLDYTGSGTSTDLINGIDWIITNRQTYHIVVASMSLGFSSEVTTVDAAVVNLVNSGVTTVVSAGNSGSGSNNIYSPGSVDETITVAASNQFDSIASYSSQGGTSRYTGVTTKPDITAPGGSFYAAPLFSADSNDWDASKKWLDVQSDDAAPMQGTSMSTPIVSGAANVLIQALGGFSSWQYTRSQALLPKMILLMTATETYPSPREPDSVASPTLERGGKDIHEGYGRINLDATVDAVLRNYVLGTTVSYALGEPPTLSDISGLGQKLAWAGNVQLVAGRSYNFTLVVPQGADYDLYLYRGTPDDYGQPIVLAKSVNASMGGQEIVRYNATGSGIHYIVVKRVSGSGTFSLWSTQTIPDVAIAYVVPSVTQLYRGQAVNITVTVRNEGNSTETFVVTTYANTTTVGNQTVSSLTPSKTETIFFIWNTTNAVIGNYTIKAEAEPVPGETNTADNTYVDGSVRISLQGDVNGDGKVDIIDLALVAQAYRTKVGDPGYNAAADLNKDGRVDVWDFNIVARNYSAGA